MVLDDNNALFANEAFYLAFTQKDIAAMDALWARRLPVVCVHPGWDVLTSRAAIVRSWRDILGNPRQPGMDFHLPKTHAYDALTLVTCYEELPGGICLATNGFVVEDDEIRMTLHHSGMCANPPGELR